MTLDIIMKVSIVIMILSLLTIPYNIGKVVGRNEYKEMVKKVDCEVGFGDVPQYEITGECLKYFKLQEGQ